MIILYILITICYVINTILALLIYDRIALAEKKLKEIIENQNRVKELISDIDISLSTINYTLTDIEDDIEELNKN